MHLGQPMVVWRAVSSAVEKAGMTAAGMVGRSAEHWAAWLAGLMASMWAVVRAEQLGLWAEMKAAMMAENLAAWMADCSAVLLVA